MQRELYNAQYNVTVQLAQHSNSEYAANVNSIAHALFALLCAANAQQLTAAQEDALDTLSAAYENLLGEV
jgi:hypothetical protein